MSLHGDCLIGIDIGTGGCKTTIIDFNGNIVSSASQEYPTYYPEPGWAEQDPDSWYEALRNTVKRALGKANILKGKISSVCIDGQVHTAVFLNEDWEILRPSIPWTDQRSTRQVERLIKDLGQDKIIEITHNPAANSFTLPQILWVKDNEPDVWNKTYKILCAKDYVRGRLTEPLWITDHSDATSTLMFDGHTFDWSNEMCDSATISLEKLPRIMPSAAVAGHVNKKASRDTGLPEGVPVSCGASDSSVENLAAGTTQSGLCFVKLATSGVISVTTSDPVPDIQGRTVTYCLPTVQQSSNGWFTKSGTASCASALKWFRDVFGTEETNVAARMGKSAFELLDLMAYCVPLGAEGLFFHPYLMGELSPYFDPYLKGSFFGITARHRKEHFWRAALEGIAFSIRDSLHIFEDLGLSIGDMRLIGGGANSQLWRQILCDILGKTGTVPAAGDASYGSALLSGITIGVFRDISEAVNRCVKVDKLTPVNVKNHETYEKLFKIYQDVHQNLATTARTLHKTLEEIR